MIDENYLQQKLAWVKYRIEQLTQIEAKLLEMRHLAEFARDYKISGKQIAGITAKLGKLHQEIMELDESSKTFWLENQ